MGVPLSVLDLAPLVAGGDVGDALRRTLDLARRAEQFGYHRYWVAEHHFTPGVASAQPALLLGQIAAVTDHIRLGSGAVQTGHQTALSIVEQFGLLDALYPGRFDLGLGRSGQAKSEALRQQQAAQPAEAREVGGLLIPKHFSWAPIFASDRSALIGRLLQQPGAESLPLGEILDQIQALLAGPYSDGKGNEVTAVPGAGADLQLWLLGSSGGESARTAGARGLPFVANYHVAPAKVLEAVQAYRSAGGRHLMVSADVIVAEDDATARRLALPYALWVRSIRTGRGAVPFPTIEQALSHEWTDADRALVADRVDTQFAGSPATVAERLRTLREVTGADELLITTITHRHSDRVRSFELLAKEWAVL
ncbi:alkanesulfonate monooxygenase SsuD/methylene tetrahydromethanopterin reductase-like flavin-dependent oxidoreductase (luciferase family) [Actinoplanes octamycinicus]|uniref:Alkanesulfonate monooxygenase SsuD/methylene tetrahydromethanopterin reductase-like flavin-dependent oxidoreductase (Luciferase family) n=1 Tax=Actinoplanes octamycinicus TaxID=135948 RepID=A0A7W7GYR9_9ACTN|nr:LLM class flavin-dependent oxidoreductase [Actinoplanes octamycinicus]MBB4740697.1 alkanesulfonate monooxygenase SsuD/methylene tetrahydromethanopterin reductase-like flavin-dependent oxidoreductase (luciferase family) [Actinoplanes octamycinicus]GIE61767.1 putative monooxygenase (luciferase-like) [Actinoplanes octamycinicus]